MSPRNSSRPDGAERPSRAGETSLGRPQPSRFMNPVSRLSESQWGLIAAALLAALVVSPALLVDIPAMTDYPNYLARMHVIVSNRSANPHPFYETVWSPIPNLAFDLLVPPLAQFISVEAATKTVFVVSEILIVTGAVALEFSVKGRHELSGFVSPIVLYSTPFTVGSLNFEFGLGVAIWGMAAWIALRNAAWGKRFVAHSIIVSGLFLSHFLTLGLYGATIGLYEAHRIWAGGRLDRDGLTTIVILATPALLALTVMKLGGGAFGSEIEWSAYAKLPAIMGSLNGYSVVASIIIVCAMSVVCLELRRRQALQVSGAGIWIGLGLLALFIILPARLFGSYYVDARVLTGLIPVMPAFLTFSRASTQLRAVVVSVLSAFAVGSAMIVGWVWHAYEADYASLLSSFRHIRPESTVLLADNGGSASALGTTDPFGYAPTLAVHHARALVPSLFAIPTAQPVRLKDGFQRFSVQHPALYAPVPLQLLASGVTGKLALSDAKFINNWQREFEFVYLLGTRHENPFPDLLSEVARGRHFVLYKILKS